MRWPSDEELLTSNRRILAERCHWPDGALDACERIDAEHPGWYAGWRDANTWSGQPAGYYAHYRKPSGSWEDQPVYGATVEDLRAAIEVHPLAEPPPFRALTIDKD